MIPTLSSQRVQAKNISESETLESLQTLVDKLAEFKRRIFHSDNSERKVESKMNDGNGESTGKLKKRDEPDQSKALRETQMISFNEYSLVASVRNLMINRSYLSSRVAIIW